MPNETKKRPTVELEPDIHRAFSIINTARGKTNREAATEAIKPYCRKFSHLLPENQKAGILATA